MSKRIFSSLIILCLFLSGCLGRLGFIIFSGAYNVSSSYNSCSLTIGRAEHNLYFSDMSLATNNVNKKVCVIRPCKSDIKEAYRLFGGEKRKRILKSLNEQKPIVVDVDDDFRSRVLSIYLVKESENTCPQLLGAESSGLLRHIRKNEAYLNVKFSVDARGRFLSGDRGRLCDEGYYSSKGLKLTLDKDVQNAVYSSCKGLKSGCAVVMDVKTSNILACVTKPDSTYIDKPLSQYCPGSVFKIVTALCALENGVDMSYTCHGQIKVGDTVFSCQNKKKHNKQGLKEALANSCNCYFVKLALTLGADKILQCAKDLGFDDMTELYNGWHVKNARLPRLSSVSSGGKTALLGFGQGELTASPLQICSMLCTIARGGERKNITLVSGVVNDKGEFKNTALQYSERAASEKSSKTLLSYLRYVVSDGTGAPSDYKNKSAGKTATAQTGRYINKREILNTWFAGVYPYDEPKYAVVIMDDNGTSGAENCCPLFRTIVAKLENI